MLLDTRAKQVANEHHDIVVIGAGFDSAFFLHQFVGRTKARVLVLEWTPRFLPNDFRPNGLYGIGLDWPISYDDLEPFCCGPGGHAREKEKIL